MRSLKGLVRRLALLALGCALIFSSAVYVLGAAPAGLGPAPGDEATVTENVRAWTPGSGWSTGERTRTVGVRSTAAGWAVEETIDGVHGPRGDHFLVHTDDALRVASEDGVRATFPGTHPLHAPPDEVAVGVPWEHAGRISIGAIDAFRRTGAEVRAGVDVVVYEARHTSQFYVLGDVAWFRAVARTAYVEPMTGMIVDYTDHETLWRMELHGEVPVRAVRELLQAPEKAWEATTGPTEASVQAMAQAAGDARSAFFAQAALVGLALLVVGEVVLWGALVRRRS